MGEGHEVKVGGATWTRRSRIAEQFCYASGEQLRVGQIRDLNPKITKWPRCRERCKGGGKKKKSNSGNHRPAQVDSPSLGGRTGFGTTRTSTRKKVKVLFRKEKGGGKQKHSNTSEGGEPLSCSGPRTADLRGRYPGQFSWGIKK